MTKERFTPRPAAPYALLYPLLCEVAQPLGYALALHGSLIHDLDIVAIPWIENAASAEELVEALVKSIYASTVCDVEPGKLRPHGRRCWLICLDFGGPYAKIDLSVMPRNT